MYAGKKKTKFCWNRRDLLRQRRCLEEFLEGKGAFCNGNESDDSENDDENCNENNEQ